MEGSWNHEYFGSLAKLTWSTSGFTYFARDPKYSWFHEHSKHWIHFLSPCTIFSLYLSVLWNGCDTTICGRRQLNIQCDVSSYILINNVTSEQGQAFDKRSYLNLRRMCLGRETFDPSRSGFCRTHSNVEFRVSYVCVRGKFRILHYKRSFAITLFRYKRTHYVRTYWVVTTIWVPSLF